MSIIFYHMATRTKKDIIAQESLVLISQLPFSILINDCICTTVSPWIWLMNRPHTYIEKYTYCTKNLKGLIHLVFRHLLGSGLRLFGPFRLWASWALDHFGFINIISLHTTWISGFRSLGRFEQLNYCHKILVGGFLILYKNNKFEIVLSIISMVRP